MSENAITILIQAHGEESHYLGHNLDVNLLSFCGYPGEYGSMEIKDGKSLDVEATKYISSLYKSAQPQSELYSQVALPVRDIYADFGIKYKDAGFVYINPSHEREFSFEPREHENCEICVNNINPKTQTKYKKCRQRSIKYCPNYGVTIVASSDPEDLPYTLQYEGNSVEDQIIKSTIANGNDITNAYWLDQILDSRAINKFQLKHDFNEIIKSKQTYLTKLVAIFKGLRFKNIYILDPSCRAQSYSFDPEKVSREQRTAPQNAEYAKAMFQNAASRFVSTANTSELNEKSGSNISVYNAKHSTIPMTPRGDTEYKKNTQLGIINHMKSLVSDRDALANRVPEPTEYLIDSPQDHEMDEMCKNNKNLTFCQTYLPYFFPTGGINTKKRKRKNIKTKRRKIL